MSIQEELARPIERFGDYVALNWKQLLIIMLKIGGYTAWTLFFLVGIMVTAWLGLWPVTFVLMAVFAVPFVILNDLGPYLGLRIVGVP